MKNALIYTLLIVVIVALLIFNITTVRRVSERPLPEKPPDLNRAPVRIYGVVEPASREIVISPARPGVVTEILVDEGDTVQSGQLLCVLENSIERAETDAARARIEMGRKAVELSSDRYSRNAALLTEGSIPESQYTRLKLEKELDEIRLELYRKELDLARARLKNLDVRAPRAGIVYLCDIREGEFFGSEGEARIVMGDPQLQIRCDVEVLWIGRLVRNADYTVLNSETLEPVGTAVYSGSSRYLRSSRFSTEDPEKRLSARYQEVIMKFTPERKGIPIRLPVMVELSPLLGKGNVAE